MGYVPDHKRMKPKPSPPNAAERRHFARLSEMGCLACGARPVQIHHVTARIEGGRIARSHQRVTPLCPFHHQIQHGGPDSVEGLNHRGFWLRYGVDLLAVADRLWAESEGKIV